MSASLACIGGSCSCDVFTPVACAGMPRVLMHDIRACLQSTDRSFEPSRTTVSDSEPRPSWNSRLAVVSACIRLMGRRREAPWSGEGNIFADCDDLLSYSKAEDGCMHAPTTMYLRRPLIASLAKRHPGLTGLIRDPRDCSEHLKSGSDPRGRSELAGSCSYIVRRTCSASLMTQASLRTRTAGVSKY